MIFVTLGTQKFQFNRLVCAIDGLVKEGFLEEEVFVQLGFSDATPECCRYSRFLGKKDFDSMIAESSLLITHGGVGAISAGLRCGKTVIAVPRLKAYGEHADDHQKQIVDAFEKGRFLLGCSDTTNLIQIIQKSKTYDFKPYKADCQGVVDAIESFIDEMEGR